MCSYYPISPETLVDAVCQDPFTDVMDDVEDINIDFILQACQNLIKLDLSGSFCGFSHLSVQEYLENHHFGHKEAHELVGTTCLKRLNCLEACRPRRLSSLFEYAATHWVFHAKRSCKPNPGDTRVVSSLQRFVGSKGGTSPNYRIWLRNRGRADAEALQFSIRPQRQANMDSYTLADCLSPKDLVSLPLAFFGLHHILPDLWRSIDLSDRNDFGASLLALAAQGGHVSTVETLIQAGSDENSFGRGQNVQTPLYAAVRSDSTPITNASLVAGAMSISLLPIEVKIATLEASFGAMPCSLPYTRERITLSACSLERVPR